MTARKTAKAKADAVKLDAEIEEGGEQVVEEAVVTEPGEEQLPIAADALPAEGDSGLAATITEIMADDRSKGRERLCVKLAVENGMDAAAVFGVIDSIAAESVTPSIAARTAATGVEAVGSEPAPEEDAVKKSWDKATNAVNARVRN